VNPNGLQVPVQVRLAALWASTMFLYVYVDILSFYKPDTVRDILRGRVWEFEIGAVVEVVLLATVVRLAWRWRAGRT
jgi:hypothetical protein